jgi:hypothetical protein
MLTVLNDCKWVDVKCLVLTISAAWEIIVFILNTVKVLISGISGTRGLLGI